MSKIILHLRLINEEVDENDDNTNYASIDIDHDKEKNNNVEILKKRLKKYKKQADLYKTVHEQKTQYMDINFISINGKEIEIKENVDTCCWWCTEPFRGIPCFLPEKYIDGIYYVYGCFCSFSCVMAYNVDLSDYKSSDRSSLIKKLYIQMMKNNGKECELNKEIKIAPSRLTLKKFGGTLTIDEFRNTEYNDNEYRIIVPPMISIVPLVEKTVSDIQKYNIVKNLDSEYGLVLKRTKPLPRDKYNIYNSKMFK